MHEQSCCFNWLLLLLLLLLLKQGRYCKTSWTRVSPIYADDTQLYFALSPITAEQQVSLMRIEVCVSHVDSWLVRNKLKLNRGKTELLVLNASHRPRPSVEAIQVSSERIMPLSSARNIRVAFEPNVKLVFFILGI